MNEYEFLKKIRELEPGTEAKVNWRYTLWLHKETIGFVVIMLVLILFWWVWG